MASKPGFSKPRLDPNQVNDFVSGSALERMQRLPATLEAPSAPLVTEPELNPRIMKQVNFDMPEPEHYRLKRLVDAMPSMSMRKFILAAIKEKMERLGAER
jgi:hypothetical protein